MRALDMFAGAGGWDLAALALGWDVDGVEIMPEARATRDAAGLRTVAADVRDVDPAPGEYAALIASPPCQTFSMAGNGAGRAALDAVLSGVARYRAGERPAFGDLVALTGDERTALVLEPLRVALRSRPEFIAWEQVPQVLPVWQACAEVLRDAGYSVAVGNLHAEQYGVPQTRKRAILVARRDGRPATLPTPTHSRYYSRSPERLDPGVRKWVSIAEALGWPDGVPVEAVKHRGRGMVERYGDRSGRSADAPAFTVVQGVGSNPGGFRWSFCPTNDRPHAAYRDSDAPAPTIAGHPAPRWVLRNSNRPKASVRGTDDPAGTLYFGQRSNWVAWQNGAEIRKVTLPEVAALQTFPTDYPFQGSKSKQFLQVGNAVPPTLASAVLGALVDSREER